MLLAPLSVSVSILLTCRKHLHDRTSLPIGVPWAHITCLSDVDTYHCLTLPLFVEVLVPSQDRTRSSKCVLEVPILHLSISTF